MNEFCWKMKNVQEMFDGSVRRYTDDIIINILFRSGNEGKTYDIDFRH